MTIKTIKLTDLDTVHQVLPVGFRWSKSWFLITHIGFAIVCVALLSQLPTIEPVSAEKTSNVPTFSDAVLTDVTYPGQGWLMVASIRVPGGVEGAYQLRWQGNDFECAVPHQPSDQLLCNLPLLPAWDQTTFDMHRLDSEAVIFQIDCLRIDSGSHSEITSSPELACQLVRQDFPIRERPMPIISQLKL